MTMAKENTLPFYILMILAMLAWGGAWVSADVIAGMCPPQIIIFWRYIITALSMIPILLLRKESFKIDSSTVKAFTLSALFLIGYSVFFFKGLEKGLAGAGGVLLTTVNPIFTYIITSILFKKIVHTKEWMGLGIGFVGGIFLLKLWNFDSSELIKSGNLYLLIGALFWSLLSISSQKSQKSCSVFVYSFYLNIFASLFTLFSINYGNLEIIQELSPLFWWNLLYLALVGTTFGTTAYFFSTKKLGAAKGSSFIFLVPVNTVILSFLIQKEVPQWHTIVGGILATTAVFLIHSKKKVVEEPVPSSTSEEVLSTTVHERLASTDA